MIEALAAVLPLALGALAASAPVVAMAAVLATLGSRAVLVSFTVGWPAGILSVSAVGLLLADGVTESADSAAWISWARIVLAGVLLVLAVRQILGAIRLGAIRRSAIEPSAIEPSAIEPSATEPSAIRRVRADGRKEGIPAVPEQPGWVRSMSNLRTGKAFGVAFALGSVNPKNAVIVLSAVSAVVYSTPVVGEQVVALVVFAAIASVGVAAPLLALGTLGDRAKRPLERFVAWFVRHSALVMGTVLALLAVLVFSTGIAGLAA